MSDRDEIVFPDDWLVALQPRRSGRPGRLKPVDDEHRAALAQARADASAEVEAILDNPLSDAKLVRLARSDTNSVKAVGVRLAIEVNLHRSSAVAVADDCIRVLGLPKAAAACVASGIACVVYGSELKPEGRGRALIPSTSAPATALNSTAMYAVSRRLLDPIRRELAAADERTWQAAVEQLAPYRGRQWSQRLATSFLVPDRRDWVSADIAEFPSTFPWWAGRDLVVYSGFEGAQFRGAIATTLAEMVTMIDAIGHEATPYLLRSLDWAFADRDSRMRILGVISRIASAETLNGLLDRVALPDVPEAFETAAAHQAKRALRVLAARHDDPFASVLLGRLLKAQADLQDEGQWRGERLPQAPQVAVPAILTAPPWTRPKPEPVTVKSPDLGLQIQWHDDEREQWDRDLWPSFDETDYDAYSTDSARFYIGGSQAAVRPKLATWRAEESSFYLENPRVLVARYELAAYPPVLRLARAKPSIGAVLLLPYVSAEVAMLMAKWLAGSRQFRPLARQWFERHGPTAVTALISVALGQASAAARTAALAVARLDPDMVRAAGRLLTCESEVEALLARDPLDLLPSDVPSIPTWLDLDLLPQVLIRTRAHAISASDVETLCRLIAASQLDDPYPGLALVAEACDPASLAVFAWTLFCTWHIAGRPAKDAWAMDALGYFGDATIADRLATMLRRWPSQGATQRAKRGVEVLALIDSNVALQHLSAIARAAKSTPLRKHAAQMLDRVGADRGLFPEQLEDLVAPDLGLDQTDVVIFRDMKYRPELGDSLELVLRSPDGQVVSLLSEPTTEADKATAAAWIKRRKAAKVDIAGQVQRLEEALIPQRTWTGADFMASIAAHPLLGRLAQRLIWNVDGRLGRVDALGDLVDADSRLISDARMVQLAHPATSDLRVWREILGARGVIQPFKQVDRDAHDGDPSRFWNEVVSAASLYVLTRRGWHWGAAGHAATRNQLFRPFGAEGSVVLHINPGVSAVADPAREPDQTIEDLFLQSPQHAGLGVFSDLPRVTRSELLRDLALLRPKRANDA